MNGNSGPGYVAGEKIWSAGFLSGYNLCIFIGIVLAFLTVAYHWRRQKYSWESLQILVILIVPFAIFGARFYTLIFDANEKGGDSWSNFFNFAGLSIYGGVIGAAIPALLYIWFRRRTIDMRTAFSIIMPTILIGQAIGRWGNFQNHEVYGQIVDGESLNWMGSLKEHMNIRTSSETLYHYRQPIFFYESMMSLFGYILLSWVLNDRGLLKPGVTGGLYMAYYGIVRLVLQIFRDSNPMNTSYFGNSDISVNLVVSSIVIAVGLFIALWWQFRVNIKIKWIKVNIVDKKLKFSIGTKQLMTKRIKMKVIRTKIVDKKLKFYIKTKIYNDIKGPLMFGSSKEYDLIKPKKEVRRFFVGLRFFKFQKQEGKKGLKFAGLTSAKYERTFRIYLPVEDETKWSKRELNKGKKNKIKNNFIKESDKINNDKKLDESKAKIKETKKVSSQKNKEDEKAK